MPEHITSVLRKWIDMVDEMSGVARARLDQEDAGRPPRAKPIDLRGEGLAYSPDQGFHRPVTPTIDASDAMDVPVFDILPPPDDPVEDKVFGVVPVHLAHARYLASLLEVLERCPSARRESWRPLGWKTKSRQIRAIIYIRDHLGVHLQENRRYQTIYGMAKCIGGTSEFRFDMPGGESPCRRCVYAWVKAGLCFKARELMRYREGFALRDLDVMLESMTADAGMTMLKMMGDNAGPLPRLLTDILSMGHAPSLPLDGQGGDAEGTAELRNGLGAAARPGSPTVASACATEVEALLKAWSFLHKGQLDGVCVALHWAERARRLRTMAEWEPLAVAGMRSRREEANARQLKRDKAGESVKGWGWIARRNIIWMHHAKQYRRDHPEAKWLHEVIPDVARNARDPETGELIRRPRRAVSAAGRPGSGALYSAETIRAAFREACVNEANIVSAELPPVPPLARPPPKGGTPSWLHDPDDVWLGVLGHITARW